MKDKIRTGFRAFLAAVTSPEAVKLERGLAAFVVFRVALAVGASASFAHTLKTLIGG